METTDKLALLLREMGVDNADEIIAGDESNLSDFGRSVNKCLGAGKRATSILSKLQDRDVMKDIKDMGFDTSSITAEYDTVEDFGESIPSFIIAKSTIPQKLNNSDRSCLEVMEGEDVCMTAGAYQAYVGQRPTLVPSDNIFREVYKPYRGQNLDGKSIFIWRSGGIGDLCFIRPILMKLKEMFDVNIVFGTRQKYHSMVEQWDDCIDDLTTVPFLAAETLYKTDYHVSFEGLIERCKDAERLDVYDLFAMHSRVPVTEYTHKMNCSCKNKAFDLFPKDYAVMQISASSPIRSPLFGSLVKVANYLSYKSTLIVSGSPSERRLIDDFISCCEHKANIINFADHTGSIVDAIRLISGARVVVAPDSSHVHIAAMQGVPCVGIYGPFPWSCRASHYEKFVGIEPNESNVCPSDGRHCFTHSYLPCEYGMKCWQHLNPQNVIDAIKTVSE